MSQSEKFKRGDIVETTYNGKVSVGIVVESQTWFFRGVQVEWLNKPNFMTGPEWRVTPRVLRWLGSVPV